MSSRFGPRKRRSKPMDYCWLKSSDAVENQTIFRGSSSSVEKPLKGADTSAKTVQSSVVTRCWYSIEPQITMITEE